MVQILEIGITARCTLDTCKEQRTISGPRTGSRVGKAPMMAAAPIEVQRNSKAEADRYMKQYNMNRAITKEWQAAARALKDEKIQAMKILS